MMKKNHIEQDTTQVLNHKDARWLDYIRYHPQANPFHHPAWISLISESYGYNPFIIVTHNNEGEITAGLPVMEIRSMVTGKRWVSLPFTDYCTPLFSDEESLNRLTDWFVRAYQDQRIPRIELRWEYPLREMIQRNSNYLTHTIKLDQDPEVVAKGLKRVHRQNIRTAENRGVRVEMGNELEHLRLYYQLQLETRQRLGVPVQPWRFFELLGKSLFEQELGFVLLAYQDDQCLAGIVFLHWGKSIVAKYAASKVDTLQLRPNNLLFWTGIQWGCEHGYSEFDFGRTDLSNSGLCRYKRGWGAVEQPLIYSTMSTKSTQGTNSKIQDIMQTVIRKSPPWVCRLTGELLYRHFG